MKQNYWMFPIAVVLLFFVFHVVYLLFFLLFSSFFGSDFSCSFFRFLPIFTSFSCLHVLSSPPQARQKIILYCIILKSTKNTDYSVKNSSIGVPVAFYCIERNFLIHKSEFLWDSCAAKSGKLFIGRKISINSNKGYLLKLEIRSLFIRNWFLSISRELLLWIFSFCTRNTKYTERHKRQKI